MRPLAELLGLRAGGLTRHIQAALVDFGADQSFAKAAGKLYRHHRVKLSASTVRTYTLKHARGIRLEFERYRPSGALPARGAGDIVAEIDGTMLPVVYTEPGKDGNARKHRNCQWKETRLSAARAKGKAQSFFAISGAEVEQAGQAWARAVALAGWGVDTRIHGLGGRGRMDSPVIPTNVRNMSRRLPIGFLPRLRIFRCRWCRRCRHPFTLAGSPKETAAGRSP